MMLSYHAELIYVQEVKAETENYAFRTFTCFHTWHVVSIGQASFCVWSSLSVDNLTSYELILLTLCGSNVSCVK